MVFFSQPIYSSELSVEGSYLSAVHFLNMYSRSTSWLKQPYANQQGQPQESATSSPTFTPQRSHPPQHFDRGSQESFSSMPDPADPTTVTKTYKSGRKASAQANLASRSKSRRRRNKGQNRSGEGTKVKSSDCRKLKLSSGF